MVGLAPSGAVPQLLICVVWSLNFWAREVGAAPAHATFYGGADAAGTNAGACGYSNVLNMGYGTDTAALSDPLFKGGDTCGACFRVWCTGSNIGGCLKGREIVVTATNFCPHGSEGGWCDGKPHFDLSQPAFKKIAKEEAGVVEVEFERVNCNRVGGVHFELKGHTHFLQVLLHNVGGKGDVTSLKVKGGNGPWINMKKSWGSLWSTGEVLDGKSLSFSVTTSDGKTAVSENVASSTWKYGDTYEGKQF